jgi:peptide/nickel transport system substrate-binding protein
MPGHEESGGLEGFGLDFMTVDGKPNQQVSQEYFRQAGFASGRYEGGEEVLMVGTGEGVAQKVAEIAKENFERMGFRVRLRLVTQDSMYTRFCMVPDADVHICPNVGWLKDFSDPQTMIDPTFNGENILESSNNNFSELDVPAVNRAMAQAELVTDAQERADAWAEVNRMVTEQAPAIPWVWDKSPILQSPNVNGVPSVFNGLWDLSFTSVG